MHKLLPVAAFCLPLHTLAESVAESAAESGAEPAMRVVAGPMNYTEGPAVGPEGGVWFTEAGPAHAVHRHDPATGETTLVLDRTASGGANGLLWLDDEGLLICRDRLDQAVGFMEDPLGDAVNIELVNQTPGGHAFNGPNDIAAHEPSRTLFFTDPRYSQRPNESGIEGVYALRFDEAIEGDDRSLEKKLAEHTRVSLATDALDKPNGIAAMEDRLLIADNGAKTIEQFNIAEDGMLFDQSRFADLTGFESGPDGMAIDEAGNVFVTIWGDGVQVLDPDGAFLGFIATGDSTSNVTFADDGGLWVTARNSLMKVSPDAVERALAGERVEE